MQMSLLVDKFVMSFIKSSDSKSLWKLSLPVLLLFMTKMGVFSGGVRAESKQKTIRWKSVPAKGMIVSTKVLASNEENFGVPTT